MEFETLPLGRSGAESNGLSSEVFGRGNASWPLLNLWAQHTLQVLSQAGRLWFQGSRHWRRTGKVFLQPASRLMQITLGNNIVPIEDRACFVTGNRHGHPFWNAGTYQVPHSTASKVMK